MSIFVFLIPLLAYSLTLAPDITWANYGMDGGDLIVASYMLGVPHPTGYPTYILLSRLFSEIPFGSIAWRYNLFSAISMAGVAWLLFHIVVNITQSKLAGMVSAWTFSFTPIIWQQAIITEVYSLNLFFVALLIYMSIKHMQNITSSYLLFGLGLIFGLGLGTHLNIIFTLPIIILLATLSKRSNNVSMFILWQFIIGILIGMSIFFYIPLRANQGVISWGKPDTLLGFWQFISGHMYWDNFFNLPVESFLPRVLALTGYFSEMGMLALVLMGVGIYWAWQQSRLLVIGFMTSMVMYITFSISYRMADSFMYLLPAFLVAGIFVGCGVKEVASNITHKSGQIVFICVLLTVTLTLGYLTSSHVSLRHDSTATKFWQRVMLESPHNAVLITSEDKHTFTLLYARHVLQQRPDVIIVDMRLLEHDWYHDDLLRTYLSLTNVAELKKAIEHNHAYEKPLFFVSRHCPHPRGGVY